MTVLRGRAAQVDTALAVIKQAASHAEAAAIAIDEVVDVDDPGVCRDGIRERLDAALETVSLALDTLEERRERLDD